MEDGCYQTTQTFSPFQHAYRLRHSTETAILKVFFDVIDALDVGNITLLALLDLTAAFDTVDHLILLQRLRRSFGIDATVLRWFHSYITGRTQAVHLSGTTTLLCPLVCGVPKGSVLGPLFVLYTADISSIIAAHRLLHHCYANDTPIYFYCCPSEYAALKGKVPSCIDALADWMMINKLHLNPSKSELLWCTTL